MKGEPRHQAAWPWASPALCTKLRGCPCLPSFPAVHGAGGLLQGLCFRCPYPAVRHSTYSWAGFLPSVVQQAHEDPSRGGSCYACLCQRRKCNQGRGTPSCVSGTRDGELAHRLAWQLRRAALASPPTLCFSLKQEKSAPATSPAQAAATAVSPE